MLHITDIFRKSKTVRRAAMFVLSKVGRRDVTIAHHHTADPIRLNCFKHRNYWSLGRRREESTVQLVNRIVRPGDVCFDVGANVGYISLILSRAAGPTGTVFAFEPDPNNLPYLRKNVGPKENVRIIESGVGSERGELELYTEDLTGQNSSFVKDFDQLSINADGAGVRPKVVPVRVPVTTLDAFSAERGVGPSLIKIDVEGFEIEVLRGAADLMRSRQPVVVVEVHPRLENQRLVLEQLALVGYAAFDERTLEPLSTAEALTGNVLCMNPAAHGRFIEKLRSAPE